MKPSGLDVWLNTGVHIEGYEVFDDEAKKDNFLEITSALSL